MPTLEPTPADFFRTFVAAAFRCYKWGLVCFWGIGILVAISAYRFSQQSLKWSGRFQPRAFMLFHDKYTAQVIPKRFFVDESEIARLRELMKRHVARAAPRA